MFRSCMLSHTAKSSCALHQLLLHMNVTSDIADRAYVCCVTSSLALMRCVVCLACTNNNKSAQSNLARGPRRGAVAHTCTSYRSLWTMARPKFAPKSTLSRGPIRKPHYLPHPWTRPTYDAERHPDPIRRFSTMHCTDRQTNRPTDRPTDRSRESLTTIKRR